MSTKAKIEFKKWIKSREGRESVRLIAKFMLDTSTEVNHSYQYTSTVDWLTGKIMDKLTSMGLIITIEIFDEEVVCQIRREIAEIKAPFQHSSNSIHESLFITIISFIKWHNQKVR